MPRGPPQHGHPGSSCRNATSALTTFSSPDSSAAASRSHASFTSAVASRGSTEPGTTASCSTRSRVCGERRVRRSTAAPITDAGVVVDGLARISVTR